MDVNSMNANTIQEAQKKARQFLIDHYQQYHHFAIFEYYPSFEGKKDHGWHYTFRSPFLHANVMYALWNADPHSFKELLEKGAQFLMEFKEPGDLWRFWKVDEAQHPVFCGVDDTAISSLVLRKLNYPLNNVAILQSRIREDGAVLTWIKADLKLFFLHPVAFCCLKYYDRLAMPQIDYWGWISFEDAEPAIVATAMAYLGENKKTMPVVQYLLDAWNHDKAEHYMYYEKRIVLAYHLARAYKEGCKSLGVLNPSICAYLSQELDNFVFAELLIAYLSVHYFEGDAALLQELQARITAEIKRRDAFMDHYPYITAKNRVYYGGAGALTAAWFIEASATW